MPEGTVPGQRRSFVIRDELIRVVAISDSIRGIAETATQVSRVAVNATVLAKRTGALASGFGVLSHELLGFTQQINLAMQNLREQCCTMVTEVSIMLRQVRTEALLARASSELDQQDSPTWLRPILERFHSMQAKRLSSLTLMQRALKSSLAEAQKTGLFGTVLARTGLIEASYAGTGTGELNAVAAEFESTIAQIMKALDALKSAVQNSRLKTVR